MSHDQPWLHEGHVRLITILRVSMKSLKSKAREMLNKHQAVQEEKELVKEGPGR
jgi:hypothetical protein